MKEFHCPCSHVPAWFCVLNREFARWKVRNTAIERRDLIRNPVPLMPDFQRSVRLLGRRPTTQQFIDTIIKKYGTHLLISATLGGKSRALPLNSIVGSHKSSYLPEQKWFDKKMTVKCSKGPWWTPRFFLNPIFANKYCWMTRFCHNSIARLMCEQREGTIEWFQLWKQKRKTMKMLAASCFISGRNKRRNISRMKTKFVFKRWNICEHAHKLNCNSDNWLTHLKMETSRYPCMSVTRLKHEINMTKETTSCCIQAPVSPQVRQTCSLPAAYSTFGYR